MPEKILITSALLYANGPLHFGHLAGAYLPADCYARFQRLQKNDVLFISGSDEYGFPITLSAELAGRSPQEHVNLYHAVNSALFKRLNFSFDHYSRTSWPGHVPFVHQFFKDLYHSQFIEERVTNQLYSESDQKFLADRYVIGTCPRCGYTEARGDECPSCGASYETTDLISPRSKITGAALVLKPTKHWFLLLDKFKEKLLNWIKTKSWKPHVLNFVKGYIEELHPRSITRDSNWGVSIPLSDQDGKEIEGKVIYVWFDAPIGYISATAEWAQIKGEPEKWKNYWLDPKTRLVHFIGKDNIPFHAAIFPAMEMGQSEPYKMVDDLPANEFFKLEGRQFSKSDGWMIDLDDFLTRYSADQIRYTLAANAPETSDSEFTWKDFQQRCNIDLLGKYGNLVNRVLVFAKNHCQNQTPKVFHLEPIDQAFLQQIQTLLKEIQESFNTFKLRKACLQLMELAQAGNIYFDSKKPWLDAKNEQSKGRMETTIACCIACLKALALASFPIIPDTAKRVWKMSGQTEDLESLSWSETSEKIADISRYAGQSLGQISILFSKIEDDQIEQEIEKLHKMAQEVNFKKENEKAIPQEIPPFKPPISFDEMQKLDLRVGTIKEANPIPKSKKLLKLMVDLGLETRQIVAGIHQSYKPEQLIGKKVVVAANLKPSVIMGVESQGMILAASDHQDLELVTANLRAGSIVK